MTCRQCLHNKVCPHLKDTDAEKCKQYADKNEYVKVVRCKDCKHNVANWKHDELDATDYTDIVCDYFMTDGMDKNDYCSYGEKI